MPQILRIGPYNVEQPTAQQTMELQGYLRHPALPLEEALRAAGIRILGTGNELQPFAGDFTGPTPTVPIIEAVQNAFVSMAREMKEQLVMPATLPSTTPPSFSPPALSPPPPARMASSCGMPLPGPSTSEPIMSSAAQAFTEFYGPDLALKILGVQGPFTSSTPDFRSLSPGQNLVSAGTSQACLQFLLSGNFVEYAKCTAKAAVTSTIGTVLPGQQPGFMEQMLGPSSSRPAQGQAGAYGVLSERPQEQTRKRLACRLGFVLGKDNMCYMKGTIPPKFRKWRPDRKPPVTAGDAKAIRRAAGAKRRVRRLAGEVGLTTHARGAHRGPQKRGKR